MWEKSKVPLPVVYVTESGVLTEGRKEEQTFMII